MTEHLGHDTHGPVISETGNVRTGTRGADHCALIGVLGAGAEAGQPAAAAGRQLGWVAAGELTLAGGAVEQWRNPGRSELADLRATTRATERLPAAPDSATCRRRRPARYHWSALGVVNAVHTLSAVSHTARLAHLRGQIGVPRHAWENHTSATR